MRQQCSNIMVAAPMLMALATVLASDYYGVAAFSTPAAAARIITCPTRPSSTLQQPSMIAIISSTHRSNHQSTRGASLQILYSTEGGDDNGDTEASSSSSSENDIKDEIAAKVVADSLTPSQIQSLKSQRNSFFTTTKDFFTNKSKFNRESLGKLGVSALLAYGFVSNVSGVLAVSSAWFIFSKKTGMSPIAPGQKPAFLAVYAGFTVLLNVIRPARFAFAMAISPYFERIRKFFQRKFGVSPRGAAVLMVIFINLLGTCSLMAAGVGLASVLSGVPVWAGR